MIDTCTSVMLSTGLTALLQSPIRRVGRGVNNTASHFAALSDLGAETLQDSVVTLVQRNSNRFSILTKQRPPR